MTNPHAGGENNGLQNNIQYALGKYDEHSEAIEAAAADD